MRVLGIDPGTRYTGLGVIDKVGNKLKYVTCDTIVTVNEKCLEDKLFRIHEGVNSALTNYLPNSVAIEKIFHSVNPHSSLILGHARGVAMLTARMANIDIAEFAPNEVKSAVVGVGRASKAQVAAMVQVLLNMDRQKKLREDESDALAIAVCCANTLDFRSFKHQDG